MNIKDAHKLKAGAIVRESWSTKPDAAPGIVLEKKYETGRKLEAQLCQEKDNRYIVTVAWFRLRPGVYEGRKMITKTSSYALMLVSHAK